MNWTDEGGIRLKPRPDEHNSDMVCADRSDAVEIMGNVIRLPIIPAEVPVLRRNIVEAETVAH